MKLGGVANATKERVENGRWENIRAAAIRFNKHMSYLLRFTNEAQTDGNRQAAKNPASRAVEEIDSPRAFAYPRLAQAQDKVMMALAAFR